LPATHIETSGIAWGTTAANGILTWRAGDGVSPAPSPFLGGNAVGEKTHFTVDNDLLIGVTRSFQRFSQSLEEVKNARIFAGIHFRFSCDEGPNHRRQRWTLGAGTCPCSQPVDAQ
jgi:hypothetical protein